MARVPAIEFAYPGVLTHAPAGIQDARLEELGYSIQNAGTAQAHGRHTTDGLNLDLIIHQAQALDGAIGRPHAVLDVGALKGRTRGAGDAGQLAMGRQADLGVGPNIDGQHHTLGVGDLCCQQHGHVVGANIAGNIGQQVGARPRRKVQPQIASLDIECRSDTRHVGRLGKLLCRQANKQVMHGRVAHDDRIDNVGGFGADPGTHLGSSSIDRTGGKFLEQGRLGRILFGKGQAGDDVLAVRDLGVHVPLRGHRPAGLQVHQVGSDLGRAQVDGQSKVPGVWREQSHDLLTPYRHQDPPAQGTQTGRELAQDCKISRDSRDTMLLRQRVQQALCIGAQIRKGGRG